MRTCADCRHYLEEEEGRGVCRRLPPVPILIGHAQTIRGPQPQLAGTFPPVASDALCGEFSAVVVALAD